MHMHMHNKMSDDNVDIIEIEAGADSRRLSSSDDVVEKGEDSPRRSCKEGVELAGAPQAAAATAMTFPDGGWEAWTTVAACTLICMTAFGASFVHLMKRCRRGMCAD